MYECFNARDLTKGLRGTFEYYTCGLLADSRTRLPSYQDLRGFLPSGDRYSSAHICDLGLCCKTAYSEKWLMRNFIEFIGYPLR